MSDIMNTSWIEVEGMSVEFQEPDDYLSPHYSELDHLSMELENYSVAIEDKRRARAEGAKKRRKMMR